MGRSLTFYRALGLPAPEGRDGEDQVQVATPGGTALGFLTEEMMKGHDPDWVEPVGQRVTFACRCDSAAEVDATYARVTDAGYEGRQEPWNSTWGQRYAMLADRDGNRVDLFATIIDEGRE